MTNPAASPIVQSLRRTARVAALGVVAIGALVITGWWLDIHWWRSLFPGLTPINPGGTALTILLAGAALWLRTGQVDRRRLGLALAAVAVLLALTRLGGSLADWDGGPDRLLFRAELDQHAERTGQPNRMAPTTALPLLLVGLALLLLDVRPRRGLWPAEVLALTAGGIALLSILGCVYGAGVLVGAGGGVPAVNTSLATALASAGVLCGRPDRGLMAILTDTEIGGATARRLLPVTVLVPIVIGGVGWLAGQQGINPFTGLTLFVSANVVLFATVIWWAAATLERTDRARRDAERRLAVQHTVSGVLAANPPPGDAVPDLLRAIGESLGWQVGLMWRADGRDGVLRCSDVWLAPAAEADRFVACPGRRRTPAASACPAGCGPSGGRFGFLTYLRTRTSRRLRMPPGTPCGRGSPSRSRWTGT